MTINLFNGLAHSVQLPVEPPHGTQPIELLTLVIKSQWEEFYVNHFLDEHNTKLGYDYNAKY